MQPLFLTGNRTPLYPQTLRKVELLDHDIFEKIQKWRMFSALWELEVEDFYGQRICYRGIKYSGSPERVFWCYFQPFFNNKIPEVLSEVEGVCTNKGLPPEEYLTEAADLLKVMVSRLWNEIAITHQVLKGDGFPKAEDFPDMSGTISAAKEKIDSEVAALLLRGTPVHQEIQSSPDDILEVKPNFMGVGINFNAAIRWAKRKWKRV